MTRWFRLPPARSTEYQSPLVLLFGFLFLIAGSAMLLKVPFLFYQKSRLDNGLELPATILRVESVRSGGGRGVSRSSLSVEYEFGMDGRRVRGDRVSIFSESEGLSFRLREAFESGREVICFVDPRDPEFSALEKDVRAMDLVGLIALGLPLGFFGALYLVRFIGVIRGRNPGIGG